MAPKSRLPGDFFVLLYRVKTPRLKSKALFQSLSKLPVKEGPLDRWLVWFISSVSSSEGEREGVFGCVHIDNVGLRTCVVLQKPFAFCEDLRIWFLGDLHSLLVEDSFTNIEVGFKRSQQCDLVSFLLQISFIFKYASCVL